MLIECVSRRAPLGPRPATPAGRKISRQPMISDRDIWAAALLLVKRYSGDAMLEAAERADQLRGTGS